MQDVLYKEMTLTCHFENKEIAMKVDYSEGQKGCILATSCEYDVLLTCPYNNRRSRNCDVWKQFPLV